jgi:hypothetical protein
MALLDASVVVVDAAGRAVEAAGPLISNAAPDRILDTLSGLETVLSDFRSSVAGVGIPAPGTLIGPLRDADARLAEVVATADQRAADLLELLPRLRSLFGGTSPRRYLLALGNNAEMRAASGSTLSYGVLSFDQGRFSLDRIGPIEDLVITDSAGVTDLPAGFADTWGFADPGRDPRNTSISALFPRVAPILAGIYEKRSGEHVDGVVAIDVAALRDVIGVIGPVPLPSLSDTLTVSNTVSILLTKVYVRYPGDPERADRQRVLSEAATTVFSRVRGGGYPAGEMATTLATLANERHLMAWSRDTAEEAVFERTGLAGGFPPDRLPILAAVQNSGANKLDVYVREGIFVDLSLSGRDFSGTLTVTIDNFTDTRGLPPYVVGPNEGLDVPAGTYVGLVSVWFPGGTQIVSVGGDATPSFAGNDGGYTVSVSSIEVPGSQRRVATIAFRGSLAADLKVFPLTVLPQPRADPAGLRVTAHLGPGWSGTSQIDKDLLTPASQNWEWHGQ